MTSAEEGQPPSNEPEEWQDTHPLSPSGEGLPYSQGWALFTPIAEMGVFVKLQLQLQFSWKLRSEIALLFNNPAAQPASHPSPWKFNSSLN